MDGRLRAKWDGLLVAALSRDIGAIEITLNSCFNNCKFLFVAAMIIFNIAVLSFFTTTVSAMMLPECHRLMNTSRLRHPLHPHSYIVSMSSFQSWLS